MNQKTLHALSLALGILAIGFSAIFVRLAHVPGTASAFWRVSIAGMVVIPWWLATRTPVLKNDVLLTILGGIFFALDLSFWNTSLLLTSVTTATVLANNAPLWVGLVSVIVFREKLGYLFWTGLFLAICGMIILSGPSALYLRHVNKGDFLALTASAFYAAYLITTGRIRARMGTVAFMAISTISAIVCLLIVNLIGHVPLGGYHSSSWLALIGLGLVPHLAGWLLINNALGGLKASTVSVALLAQSAVTMLLAMPILRSFPTIFEVLGAGVVLGGIGLVTRSNWMGDADSGTTVDSGRIIQPDSTIVNADTVSGKDTLYWTQNEIVGK